MRAKKILEDPMKGEVEGLSLTVASPKTIPKENRGRGSKSRDLLELTQKEKEGPACLLAKKPGVGPGAVAPEKR